jgi:hypothetical protein
MTRDEELIKYLLTLRTKIQSQKKVEDKRRKAQFEVKRALQGNLQCIGNWEFLGFSHIDGTWIGKNKGMI